MGELGQQRESKKETKRSLPVTRQSVKREEKPVRLDLASKMNGHDEEANGEYDFTRKISNSFAESIMASSPSKANGAMGDGCDSGEGEQMEEEQLDLMQGDPMVACHLIGEKEQMMRQGQEHLENLSAHLGDNQALLQMDEELPQHPALLQCSSRKDGDSGFISPEQQGSGSTTGEILNDPNILDFNRKDLGKTLDSSMDSDDVREDKEKEKEKPMMADMNEGYEYIAYDNSGCQEGINEKRAPSPLLDFGEDCEVESQKLQDDRIGGEKGDAIKTEKDESASSSSEDEAENVKENGEIPGDVASDSDSEGEERPLGRKASSCYSSSEEEGKSNNNEDSEEEEEVINKKETQDGLNESLIKKDDDNGQSSEDEVEKEVSVEKETENVSQDGVAVDAEVVQEVDFEAKYQR